MSLSQIWHRYFLKELLKVFLLFIGCFYFLYVLIDYSAHTKIFHQQRIGFMDVGLYYMYQFTKQADILIPIALLIAVVKVLTTLNIRNEIGAMVVAGAPIKRLMHPFLLAAAICAFLLYLNFQFLQPFSLNYLHTFEEKFFKNYSKEAKQQEVQSLLLKDTSLLFYQRFDPKTQVFFDVYWLKSHDQFYRIKTLVISDPTALGKYVDTLVRTSTGEIVWKERHTELLFPEMQFDKNALFSACHPPRRQSLTQLFRNLSWKRAIFGMGKLNDREAETLTSLLYKLAFPLTCLLTVIAPAPFCVRFGRRFSLFKIYTFSLCGIITFFTLVNSSIILGESQVVPPFLAIVLPYLFVFVGFGWKYVKLQ